MQIIRKFTFDAAHYLPSYHGKCERLHGHTYRMSVKVDGKPDYEGMVMDFAEMKKIVNEKVIEQLDHKMLNDIFDVPSAENIAIWVWNTLKPCVDTESRKLDEVEIWETESNGCVYRGN